MFKFFCGGVVILITQTLDLSKNRSFEEILDAAYVLKNFCARLSCARGVRERDRGGEGESKILERGA
jgi:hypothetical protein